MQGAIAPRPDRWAIAVLVAAVCVVFSGALLSPAFFTQAQSVDAAAALAGLTGLVAATSIVASGRDALPATRLGFAWVAFVAWAFVASIASGRSLAAFMGEPTNMLGWGALASLVVIAGALSLRAQAGAELLRVASPWLLAAQVAYIAIRFLLSAGQPIIPDLVGGGSLPNSTAFAEFAVLLLPWVLVPPPKGRTSVLPAPVRWAIVAATLVALFAGGSRTGLVVALLWLAWVGLSGAKLTSKSRALIMVGGLAVVLAAIAFYVVSQWNVVGGQLGLRPEFSRVSARAVAASPVLGYGPDGFLVGGASISTTDSIGASGPLVFARGSTDPHNFVLWVAVSTGIVGLALFLWGAVEIGVRWRERANQGEAISAAVWSVAGATVLFFTAPATLAVLPLFAFVVGATVPARPSRRTESAAATRWAGIALVAVAGLAAALFALNAATRFGLESPSAEESPALASRSSRAAALWALDPYLYHLASMHLGWAASADPTLLADKPDLLAAEKAAALDRRDPFIALELARARRGYGLPEAQVKTAFDDTFRRWPVFPLAHVEYAGYLASLGRTQEALARLDFVDGLNADDPQARLAEEMLRQSLAQ